MIHAWCNSLGYAVTYVIVAIISAVQTGTVPVRRSWMCGHHRKWNTRMVQDQVRCKTRMQHVRVLVPPKVIDWIMKRSTAADNTTDIRLNMTSKLDDYADDIALRTSSRDQMQVKLDRLVRHAKSTGLKINASKTKVMRVNASNTQAIIAAGEEIEDVSNFVYLGGTVNTQGGTTEDIRRRLGHARSAYNNWNPFGTTPR